MKEIVVSDDFLNQLDALPSNMKSRAMQKIALLAEDPSHPSLNSHKLKRAKGKWESYITDAHRFIYDIEGDFIRLWHVGDHTIIDRVHNYSFSPHTAFRRLEKEEPDSIQAEPFYIPEEWLKPDVEQDNPFTFLPASHLRILGIPPELIKAVRSAPSVEAATTIPGLSDLTVEWMLEFVTNPDLESALFSPGRLIFRTTLDKLQGYCSGYIKRLMLNLEDEQQKYVQKKVNGALLLRGCAGSGKTTIAIYRAIGFAESGRKTIFLTFNRTLSAAAKTLIEELIGPIPENLEVINMDSWIARFLNVRGYKLKIIDNEKQRSILIEILKVIKQHKHSYIFDFPWTFFRDEISRVIKGNGLKREEDYLAIPRYGRSTALKRKARLIVWAVYEKYQQVLEQNSLIDWQDLSLLAYRELFKKNLDLPYNHVIIDEAQDLTAIQIRVAQRMMKGSQNSFSSSTVGMEDQSIFLVGDVSQTLYSRGFTWKQAGLNLQGKSNIVRKNYRNTRQIAEAAAALNSYNRVLNYTDEYVDPKFSNRQGSWPIVIDCDSRDREVSAVCEKILSLAGGNYFRVSDFVVLCPSVQMCELYHQRFEQIQLPSVLRTDKNFDILEEKVKILTIHSAKGLEFPVVFIAGLHEGLLPNYQKTVDDEEAEISLERQRTLLYVGMTRASEALYLVTSVDKPSSFIAEIEKHLHREPFLGGK